jgi:hypothetical protein
VKRGKKKVKSEERRKKAKSEEGGRKGRDKSEK